MPNVVWGRKDEIEGACAKIPAQKQGSLKNFRPPPTIESDFKRLLDHDVPHVNFTFELVHDWYLAQEDGYSPIYIRAQQTPIDWKSKIGNSDMSTNFKVTHEIPIYKGDIVVREDGIAFLLNWNVQSHPNNQASQCIECNSVLRFTREVPDEIDDDGYLVAPGGTRIIANDIPCVHEEYAGRPDYAAAQGAPGINADHLITCSLQWNSQTQNIKLDDQFVIGDFTYRVINVTIAEVNINSLRGIVKLNARRIAGGIIGE